MGNIDRVIRKIKQKGIDAFLVTSPADLFYITGREIDCCWAVVSHCFSDGIKIISPEIMYEQAKFFLRGLRIYGGRDNIKTLAGLLERHSEIRKVGIDTERVSVEIFSKIQKTHARVFWKGLPGFISDIRMVKSADEIQTIRVSCMMASEVFERIKGFIRPGLKEREVANKIRQLFMARNVEPSFAPIVASGINSAFPHHITSGRAIREGEPVIIDIGCRYNGYCSDLTKTIFLGKMNRSYKKIYNTVRRAQKECIAAIKPGVRVQSIDMLARRIIGKAGLGGYFVHSTGHGVGIEVHEPPRLAGNDETVLEPGMVITVEPGVYVPGKGGVRIEDVVLVTRTGNEVLTGTSRARPTVRLDKLRSANGFVKCQDLTPLIA
ncbi:MAG: Xaa-Pro peptidase family protein [Elusimicrobiota bacterium]